MRADYISSNEIGEGGQLGHDAGQTPGPAAHDGEVLAQHVRVVE
jgi:hypothetical protein